MALESATYINSLNVSNPATTDAIGQADDHIRMLKAVLKNTFPNVNAACNATPLQLNQYFVPVGGIIMWSGSPSAVPTGWALCDGGSYTKSGGGTLTAPDLRDKFIKGCGGSTANPTATPTVGSSGGSKTHTHTVTNSATAITKAMLPDVDFTVTESAHTHTLTDPGHFHNTGQNSESGGTGTSPAPSSLYANSLNWNSVVSNTTKTSTKTTGITLGSAKTNLTVNSGGSGATHTHTATVNTPNHEPQFYTLAFIIKL